MEQINEYLRRKSKLLYDINCIQKYIDEGCYDKSLEVVWNDYKKELKEIEQKKECDYE